MNFAFYGQAMITDRQQARPIRARQLADATTRVEAHGGRIVRTYFDIYPDRFRAWRYRRQAARLLAAVEDQQRGFAAIIISDTRTAFPFYHHFDDVQQWCVHHDVQLWVPEIDGPADRYNFQHALIMATLLWGQVPAGLRAILAARQTPQP
jgi:hypothetical protein